MIKMPILLLAFCAVGFFRSSVLAQEDCSNYPFQDLEKILSSLPEDDALEGRMLTEFSNISMPTWSGREEFYRDLERRILGEFSETYVVFDGDRFVREIHLYLKKHPEAIDWVVDELLVALDRYPKFANMISDSLSLLRALYLDGDQVSRYDQIVNQWAEDRAIKTKPRLDEVKSEWLASFDEFLKNSFNARVFIPRGFLAALALILDAQFELIRGSDKEEEFTKHLKEGIKMTREAQSLVDRRLDEEPADDDESRLAPIEDFLADPSVSDDVKLRVADFLNRAQRNEIDEINDLEGRNYFQVLFELSEQSTQIFDTWGTLYYGKLLRSLLASVSLDEADKAFLESELQVNQDQLEVIYRRVFPSIAMKRQFSERMKSPDGPLRGEDFDRWSADLVEIYSSDLDETTRPHYMITWSMALAGLIDPKVPQWFVDDLRVLVDESENPFALPYFPVSGMNSFESVRGAAARGPMVHYLLYKKAEDLAEKERRRESLIQSLEKNFLDHLGSLLVRSRRSNHSGNHELKVYELPSEFPQDGLAPYYYYPTLPWVVEAIKDLERDEALSEGQQVRLKIIRERTLNSILSNLSEENRFRVPEDEPETHGYVHAFGALALWRLTKK